MRRAARARSFGRRVWCRLLGRDSGRCRVTLNQLSRFGCGSRELLLRFPGAEGLSAAARGLRVAGRSRARAASPVALAVAAGRAVPGATGASVERGEALAIAGRGALPPSVALRTRAANPDRMSVASVLSLFHQVTSTGERAKEHAGSVRTCASVLTAAGAEFGSSLSERGVAAVSGFGVASPLESA
jgi:hypothetical protein